MKRIPRIGERVYYPGRDGLGACAGVVTEIYPSEEWTDDEENPRPTGRMLPIAEWHVAMRVDEIPDPWPYIGSDQFAPQIRDLRAPVRAAAANRTTNPTRERSNPKGER